MFLCIYINECEAVLHKMKSIWKIHKYSMLVTSYDKLTNPIEIERLKKYSETITHTKYDKLDLFTEEYMHFYAHNDVELFLVIFDNKIKINLIKDKEKIDLLVLPVQHTPNIRINGKDNKMYIKYYVEWEKKHQISFYSYYDYKIFALELKKMLEKAFYGQEYFVKQMEDLTGKVKMFVLETGAANQTIIDLKKEYYKLVELGYKYKK